jgi:hypothetical protein
MNHSWNLEPQMSDHAYEKTMHDRTGKVADKRRLILDAAIAAFCGKG